MDVSENEIGLREGRAKFGDLVNRAEYSGEITYVTRHGRRVAAIVPISLVPQEPTMTAQDLAYAVSLTLGDHIEDYDIDAIVADIFEQYGRDIPNIDAVPTDEYWAIVEKHDTTA